MATTYSANDRLAIEAKIKAAFSPHSPINTRAFFSGRIQQIRAVVDAVTTPGLHAVLYGERGVGKTSLANIIAELLQDVLPARVQCSESDTFDAIIRRAVGGLRRSRTAPGVGFAAQDRNFVNALADELPAPRPDNHLSPDAVAELLAYLPRYVVLVIDEFDRLPRPAAAVFADLIKAVSDRGAETTIVLVGVAEDVNHLISNHASVERCLRQIRLSRMSEEELSDIIDKGLAATGFKVARPMVKRRIVTVSQGFPHYTHALGQNSARKAFDAGRMTINDGDVTEGMRELVEFGDQSHRELYHLAVTGTKPGNKWKQVVAACALAETDERGFFSSRAVQDSLSKILGRPVIQQTVAFHLGKLTEATRGPLLERKGPERRYRYRFINPLMRPFTLIKSTTDGVIPEILRPEPLRS